MFPDTHGNNINRVLNRLSLVPGIGTQKYKEDTISAALVDSFYKHARRDGYWWPNLCDWYKSTLDGVTGVCVDNIGVASSVASFGIQSFFDIKSIFLPPITSPIPTLPGQVNPFTMSSIGPYAQPFNNAAKLFKIWPLTATGTVYLFARVLPNYFTSPPQSTDTVPFDFNVLCSDVVAALASSDSSDDNNTKYLDDKYKEAVKALEGWYNQQPIVLDPRGQYLPSNYWDPTAS